MQSTVTIAAAFGAAFITGLLGLIAALLNSRSAGQQTRLAHQLELQDHTRQEREDLYRDMLTWCYQLSFQLGVIHDTHDPSALLSLLCHLTEQYGDIAPRLWLSSSQPVAQAFVDLAADIDRLAALLGCEDAHTGRLTHDQVAVLALVTEDIVDHVGLLRQLMRTDLGIELASNQVCA